MEKAAQTITIDESNQRLNELADAMPHVVWIAAPDGTITYYNKRVADFSGAYQKADGSWHWESVVHPDDLDSTVEAWTNALRNGTIYEKEHRVMMKDGSVKWHLSRGLPQKDAHGKVLNWYGTATNIHDQKIASERIRESEEQLRIATETAELGYWDFNPFTNELKWSDRCRELFALPADRPVTMDALMAGIHPDDRQYILDDIEERTARRNGDVSETEYRIIGFTDKKLRWIRTKGRAFYNQQGDCYRFTGTVQDITLQKESDLRFRRLFEMAPVSIWEEDFSTVKQRIDTLKQMGITDFISYFKANPAEIQSLVESIVVKDVNSASLALLAATDKTEIKEGLQNLFIDDTLPAFLEELNLIASGGGRFEYESVVKNFKGHRLDILIRIDFPTHDDYSSILVTLFDISERKQIEQTLLDSERRFRLLAETLPQLVWTTDSVGNQEYASSRWKEYSGIDPVGADSWNQIAHPEDNPTNSDAWAQSLQVGSNYKTEIRLKNKEGVYRWHSVQGEPVLDESGNITKWIGAFTDIHDQKTLTEQLEKLVAARTSELYKSNQSLEEKNNQLQLANKELESFNYIASHDLQEPLRKIQTFINLLQEPENDEAIRANYLARINNSAQRMSELIKAVLNYSQLAKTDEPFVDTNLNEVLQQVTSDLELVIDEKKAEIRSDDLPIIQGIPVQMHQLFTNLISNSLKFSARQPVITITATRVSRDELPTADSNASAPFFIKLGFQDNGIGFDQQYATKIFTLFQRLHSKQTYTGTGIGLTICKRIIEKHNGFIEAKSKLGEGTLFLIYLPIGD